MFLGTSNLNEFIFCLRKLAKKVKRQAATVSLIRTRINGPAMLTLSYRDLVTRD